MVAPTVAIGRLYFCRIRLCHGGLRDMGVRIMVKLTLSGLDELAVTVAVGHAKRAAQRLGDPVIMMSWSYMDLANVHLNAQALDMARLAALDPVEVHDLLAELLMLRRCLNRAMGTLDRTGVPYYPRFALLT